MKLRLPLYFLLALLVFSPACKKQVIVYQKPVSFDQPFITAKNRKLAEELKEKFPKTPFYGRDCEVLVEFYLHDPKKKGKKEGKKGKPEKKEKKEEELIETELRAKVTYFNTVLALSDFADFQEHIFYNEQQKVGPVSYTYTSKNLLSWKTLVSVSQSYETDDMYYSDARVKSFEVPIPARGTELTYTYTVDYKNINYLANLFFHESFPMEKKNITFKVPDWLQMEVLDKNLTQFGIERGTKQDRGSGLAEFLKQAGEDEEEEEPEESGKKPKKKKPKRVKYSYVSYQAKNLNAQKYEKLAAGPTHNYPHVVLSIKKYTNNAGKEVSVMAGLSDLYGWYHTLVKSVENDTAEVAEKARSLTEGLSSDEEKVKAVFYWVQDNIRYIAYEDGLAGFRPDACQEVFKNRYGDCKGMANLVTQMLRSLKYDARLTWIGTRRIAYNYSVPNIAVDNHMICTLILNGKRYFLDPTEDFIAFDDYAHRIQGRPILIENGDTFMIDTIPNLSHERNRTDKTEKLRLEGNELTGQVEETYRGENKTRVLRSYNAVKSDRKATALERFLNDENVNLGVSNIVYSQLSERSQDIRFQYSLRVKNHVLPLSGEWLVSLDWERELYHMDMDSTRIADMDMGWKWYTTKTTTVQLPANSRIRYMPKKVDVQTEHYRILMEYQLKGDQLVYTKTIIFFDGRIPQKGMPEWNLLHKQIRSFYEDYVVITKP